MQKIFTSFMIIMIIIGLSGCGKNPPVPDNKIKNTIAGKKFLAEINESKNKSILFIYRQFAFGGGGRSLTYGDVTTNKLIGRLENGSYLKYNLTKDKHRIASYNKDDLFADFMGLGLLGLVLGATSQDDIVKDYNLLVPSPGIYCIQAPVDVFDQDNNKIMSNIDTCLNDIKTIILKNE